MKARPRADNEHLTRCAFVDPALVSHFPTLPRLAPGCSLAAMSGGPKGWDMSGAAARNLASDSDGEAHCAREPNECSGKCRVGIACKTRVFEADEKKVSKALDNTER